MSWVRMSVLALIVVSMVAVPLAGEQPVWAKDTAAKKAKRKKLLADLDREVGALEALVRNVERRQPCNAGSKNGKSAKKPPPNRGRRANPSRRGGRRPAIKRLPPGLFLKLRGGGPFCPEELEPHRQKIMKLINELNPVIEGDKRAGAVRSWWPQYLVSFKTQLDHLAKQKEKHKSPGPVGKKCGEVSKDVLEHGRRGKQEKSLQIFSNARKKAQRKATDVKHWVREQESIKRDMKQWYRNVRLFHPKRKYDGAWKRVYQAMHKSSKKIHDQWLSAWKKASESCEEPAKGEDHADLKKLEDELHQALKQELVDDLKKWEQDTKKVYDFDCDSMKKLWKSYCGELDGDLDGKKEKDEFDKEAEKLADQVKAKLKDRRPELKKLKRRAHRLKSVKNGRTTIAKQREWKKELTKAIDDPVKEHRKTLSELEKEGVLKGQRNPKIQLWTKLGKQAHKIMERKAEYACTLADRWYCAQWIKKKGKNVCVRKPRPDCVSVTHCKIYEFKPDSSEARAKGEKQLQEYKALLEKHYNKGLSKWRDHKKYWVVGGRSVLQGLERHCAKGGTLNLDITNGVKTYKRCEFKYECQK